MSTSAPVGREPLCYGCTSGLVLRGASESEEIIFCNYGSPLFRIPFRVLECTGYSNREQAPLYQMEDAARVIEVPLARKVGFQRSNGDAEKE